MSAEAWGAIRFVITADGLHFCHRNGLRPSARTVVWGGAAVCAGALALAAPAGAVAGMLAARLGRVLEVGAGGVEGLVVVIVALRALAATASAATRKSRLSVFAPADLPVLRGLDIPLWAVLVGRVAWPGLLRQMLTGLAAVGALFGIALMTNRPVGAGTVVTVGVLALSGALAPVALAGCPPRRTAPGPGLLGSAIAAAVAAVAGALGGAAAAHALRLAKSLGPAELGSRADALARHAGAYLATWGVAASVALVAGALLWHRLGRTSGQWRPDVPLSGPAPTRDGRRPRYPLLTVVPRTMARGTQSVALALRRALHSIALAGLASLGAGCAAPGLLTELTGGNDRLSGGGALLAAATLIGVLCGSVAGPGVLLRQLRWTWEQGHAERELARSHIAGLLGPVALAMTPACAGIGLLADSPLPALYGLSLAVAATAGAVLSDLVETGRQENPDGTGDAGNLGGLACVAAIAAATVPWMAPVPVAVGAGPLTALGCLALADRILRRKIIT
ncbi:hypothetical protein [Streptomyces sp. BA2]|uniref:hypothetical protein n=1 Tax=Streptomyces sp. BA2 TaxID=436595 RepID=UPI00136E56EE|nr:hypothetical protein [Streptomyces sp. BA2]